MRQFLLAAFALTGLLGCESEVPPSGPPTPTANAGESAGKASPTGSAAAPAYEPEYTLAIEPDADGTGSVVKWSALVNSGGWTLTTEQVLIEDSMGATIARVYAILEQPGSDAMVTQALETLHGEHASDQNVTKAELSVKRTRRDADATSMPLYSVVKTVP